MAGEEEFFRLLDVADDGQFLDRWFLGSPVGAGGEEIDPRLFTRSRRVSTNLPSAVVVRSSGQPLDFTFADFDMPVVRNFVGDIFEAVAPASVQRIPVEIQNSSDAGFEILNVLPKLRCLDEPRSVHLWWKEADDRPDRIGSYRSVGPIVLRAASVRGHDVFRIDGWHIALLVSGKVKQAIERHAATGLVFERLELT